MVLAFVTVLVFLVNLPFGYWRSTAKRFSLVWFLSIHIPVPIVIVLRHYSGIGFHWATYPVLIGAFFLGQFAGKKFVMSKAKTLELQGEE